LKFQKGKAKYLPSDNEICTVKRTGSIIQVMTMTSIPVGLKSITKISKDEYVDNKTGELKEYKHTENRSQNSSGLKHSFGLVRDLINNNFTGALNELFITTTYKENMTDTKRLYHDNDVFMKRFKRKYPNIEYLIVVEPQGRSAWHCHILIKDSSVAMLYIPNEEIAKMWGHGFTTTRRIQNCDNIGAYLTAYLADIPLDEYVKIQGVSNHVEIVDKVMTDNSGKQVTKRIVKGGRCYLYPPGMNIVRHSRGIKPTEKERMTGVELKRIVGPREPCYSKEVEIQTDEGKHLNTIRYLQYNLNRSEKQGVNRGHDDATGIERVFDCSEDSGKQHSYSSLLPELPVSSAGISGDGQRSCCVDLEGYTEIQSSSSGSRDFKQQSQELYQGDQSLFDMDVSRGIHKGRFVGKDALATGPEKDNRGDDG